MFQTTNQIYIYTPCTCFVITLATEIKISRLPMYINMMIYEYIIIHTHCTDDHHATPAELMARGISPRNHKHVEYHHTDLAQLHNNPPYM
jgi:hypothetical protein